MRKIAFYAIQFAIILLIYGIGYSISWLSGGILPGSVVGMILMFIGLYCKVIKSEWVRDAANFLIQYMVLFFVPPAVGIMVSWTQMEGQMWAVIVSLIVSTIAVIAVVGLTQQRLENKKIDTNQADKGGKQ